MAPERGNARAGLEAPKSHGVFWACFVSVTQLDAAPMSLRLSTVDYAEVTPIGECCEAEHDLARLLIAGRELH